MHIDPELLTQPQKEAKAMGIFTGMSSTIGILRNSGILEITDEQASALAISVIQYNLSQINHIHDAISFYEGIRLSLDDETFSGFVAANTNYKGISFQKLLE